jgi:hypothetical protein
MGFHRPYPITTFFRDGDMNPKLTISIKPLYGVWVTVYFVTLFCLFFCADNSCADINGNTNHSPEPVIKSYAINKSNVLVDEPFIVTVKGTHNGSSSVSYGGIAVQIRQAYSDGVEVTESHVAVGASSDKSVFWKGEPLARGTAKYLHVEPCWNNWNAEKENTLKVTITPRKAGTYDIYCKMYIYDGSSHPRDPSSDLSNQDHQKEATYKVGTVIVSLPEPDLAINKGSSEEKERKKSSNRSDSSIRSNNPPSASVWGDGSYFTILEGKTETVVVNVKNNGGQTPAGTVFISVSNGLEIIDINGMSINPNSFTEAYREGIRYVNFPTNDIVHKINTKNSGLIIPSHQLVQATSGYLHDTQRSFTVRVRAKTDSTGIQWIKHRVEMANMNYESWNHRSPTSGEPDQQGWHAEEIIVSVSKLLYYSNDLWI